MRISAIVPAYNSELYLARAVESLIGTDYADLEIIVVEDGSSDNTLAVAHELAERFPGTVKVIRHDDSGNHGASASRNLGIRTSTGDVICFLDADDFVYPYRFDAAIPLLESNSEVEAVYELAMITTEKEDEGRVGNWEDGLLFGITDSLSGPDLLRRLLRGKPWAISAIVCRRSLLNKTGLFHEGLSIAEDCHLWFRMACVGRIMAGDMTRPVSTYCRHVGNCYRPAPERKVDMVRAMADAYRRTRRQQLANGLAGTFAHAVRVYVTNAVIVVREAGRPDLAWKIIWTTVVSGFPGVIAGRGILRQMASLCRHSFLSRA